MIAPENNGVIHLSFRSPSKKSSARTPRRCTQWLALLLILAGCTDDKTGEIQQPTPLPFALGGLKIPDDEVLLGQIDDALETKSGSKFDRDFDAIDPGELIEHATFSQLAIDALNPSPEDLFTKGDELFEYTFRLENGLGNGLAGVPGIRAGALPAPNMRRVHKSNFGGPDSYSCVACHSKGGPDGAGTNTQNAFLRGNGKNANTADERSAPHLLGLGPIEALGREMSGILATQRSEGIAKASAEAHPITLSLRAKGIDFGKLRIGSDGTVDTSNVSGIDPDLIVRPFGWKGHQASIRGMAEESFRIHMGILSTYEQQRRKDGEVAPTDYGNGIWFDTDRDNHHLELDSGMLTSMVAYLSQLEIPIVRPPSDPALVALFTKGQELFVSTGCAGCHTPSLLLNQPELRLVPRDKRYVDRKPILINVATDGDKPKIEPAGTQGYTVRLFSDLKRHDMGDKLTSGYKQGHLPKSLFLTRPLWGLSDTAPFLHDGRAPTIHDAIVWHGGEASDVRDNYLGLTKSDKDALLIFLLSLDREPKLVAP